jgi:hypothetical protein
MVSVTLPEAVALTERVIEVFATKESTVAPAGMPVPEIGIPLATPVVEATPVITALPLEVVPVVVIGAVPVGLTFQKVAFCVSTPGGQKTPPGVAQKEE